MTYLHALARLLWMTLIHWALLFPVTILVTVGGLWLLLKRHPRERPPLGDRRLIGASLVQLWLLIVSAWVAAAAVSPGSGLGAL